MSKRSERDSKDTQIQKYLEERAAELDEANGTKRSRSLALNAVKDQLFLEQVQAALEASLTSRYVVGKEYKPKKASSTKRILNLLLGDLHFGANLDQRECPLQYGRLEESRRIAAVVKQTAEYKLDHRDETELYIHLLGDLIQGQLHDPRDGAPLAEQIADAIHLLTQAIVFLSGEFKKVTVFCTTGNHGRNTARHNDRAVCQKFDSHETVIYYALKTVVAHIRNVTVEIPRTPYYSAKIFGMSLFATHGDSVLKPGFPNRSIEVESVRKQINELNSSRGADQQYECVVVGHVHTASCTRLPNNVMFISNGCLIPTDQYAQSIGITCTACCQTLFESVPGIIVGDRRDIIVNQKTDKDESLDKIIQPFSDF